MAIKDPVWGNTTAVPSTGIQNPPDVTVLKDPQGRVLNVVEAGIWVGPQEPSSPVTYGQWLAGTPGFWAWVQT